MMFCNFAVNVKYVLKIMHTQAFQILMMLMVTDQDSSMVQMLAKLRVTLTWSSLITIHLLCLNIHYHCWQCLQLLLLSRPFLVIQGYQ